MAEKHDKLDSRFSIVSAFWQPHSPDEVLTGTLTSSDEGLTFTTAPLFAKGISIKPLAAAMRLSDSQAIPRMHVLHGFSEDGVCTLCGLIEVGHPGLDHRSLGQSIEANSYRALSYISGLLINGSDDPCLVSARYSFQGLSEYLPSPANEIWETDRIVLTVPLYDKEVSSVGVLSERIHIHLKIFSALTSGETDGSRGTRPVPFVEVESDGARSLSWYLDTGNRLENLFSLLIGSSVALETIFINKGPEESGSVVSKRNQVLGKFGVFDCVRCTPSQLSHCFATWFSETAEFRSVENLALGVLRKGQLLWETELLSLAQALEGFHRATTPTTAIPVPELRGVRRSFRRLIESESVAPELATRLCDAMAFANEPPFRQRLREICSLFSEFQLGMMGITTDEFVADVVATRNFYTHAGSKQSTKRRRPPLDGAALLYLNQKMRALLRGALLLHLGLPEGQIGSQLKREATRWSY
jgi:hypothetical protein